MKELILTLAATACLALGQATAPAPLSPGEIIRVLEVKNGDAGAIQRNLGSIFPGVSQTNGRLIVRGQPAVVDMIEEAIKKLDVAAPDTLPALNVELTLQLLYGSAQEATGAAVATDLDATVRQLRALFPYKSYRMLDAQVLRSRSGQSIKASGSLPNGKSSFQFEVLPFVMSGAAPRSIRMDRLNLNVRQLFENQFIDARIETSLEAREGQKTVVGKANVTGTDDAIILVITPKVIQ
jgi:hypothetical protein